MKARLLVILPLLLAIPHAAALSTPQVTFIPQKFSADASFLALVTTDTADPVRVRWLVGGVATGYGLFPKSGGHFLCTFSNTDPNATCGPTPFTNPTGAVPYQMQVNATNQRGEEAGTTIVIDVGGIRLAASINIVNTTAAMIVQPSGAIPTAVTYAIYAADNLTLLGGGFQSLSRDSFTGYWLGNATLTPGDYYIAFSATSSGDFGGMVEKVSIPGASPGVCTLPPKGEAGMPLRADPVSLSILIEKNAPWKKAGFSLTNVGNATLKGLKAAVPLALADKLNITLDRDTLAVNDTALFTVHLQNIGASLTINTVVDVLEGAAVRGQIPVTIPITVFGEPPPVCPPSQGLALDPAVVTASVIAGQSTSRTVTLTNALPSPLAALSSSVSSGLTGIVTATLPSSVPASGKGTVTLDLNAVTAGDYEGTVTISSDQGSGAVIVSLRAFDDLSSKLDGLKAEADEFKLSLGAAQTAAFSETLTAIDDAISSANSKWDAGDYRGAENSFVQATSQLAAAKGLAGVSTSPPKNGGGTDLTMILLVVAVAAGIGAFFFLRKRKAKGSIEEELDEELGQEMKER